MIKCEFRSASKHPRVTKNRSHKEYYKKLKNKGKSTKNHCKTMHL